MFDVGGGELILIVLAIILLFGPKSIPDIMNTVGKGFRHVREAQESIKTEFSKMGGDTAKEIKDEIDKVKEVGKDVSNDLKKK